jgi:hypothetical protein
MGERRGATVRQYAIGFRDHTGWAAAVLVEAGTTRPRVLASRRLQLCPPELPNEVYHAAGALDGDAGKALVAAVADTVRDMATEQLREILAEFGAVAADVVAGVPAGTGRIPGSLAAITRAHAMMHAAEGHLYREALADACASLDLVVYRYPSKQLGDIAATRLAPPGGLGQALTEMGAGFGPPWTRDQKDAVVCAWLALESAG